jgi:phosphotriesterase-related protein
MRETRSDLEYVEEIAQLAEEGYLDRVLVALDICFKDFLTVYGGYGYAHIQRNLIPVMKYKGFTEKQIHTLLVENPRRLLTFAPAG